MKTRTMTAFPVAALVAALSACGPTNPMPMTDSGPMPTDDGGMPDVDTGVPPPDGGTDTGTDGGSGMSCTYDDIFDMTPVTGGPMMPPSRMPGSESCTTCTCTDPASGTCGMDGSTSCNSEHLPTGYTYSRVGFPSFLYERIRHDVWFDTSPSEWNSYEIDGQIGLSVGGLGNCICGMEGDAPVCWSLYRDQNPDQRWFRITFDPGYGVADAVVHYEGTPATELYTVRFGYSGDA